MSEKQINILLVDDRPENLLALEAVLSSPEYNLVRACSGEEALKCVLIEDFALILLDVQMPGLNGFETAKLVRQRKKSQNIPIVFITAINNANEYVIQGYNLGATDYIIKPFHPDTLKLKIQAYIKIYQDREILEKLVQERTSELIAANQKLQQEVNERQRVAEKLMKSNNRVTNILESISDAFISLDKSWSFTYINKEATCILNKSSEELIGRNIWNVMPDIVYSTFYKKLHEAMDSNKAVHFEVEDRGFTFYDIHAYPYIEGLSIYLRDITENKRLEKDYERIERLNLIAVMAAGISHEVRNPMTTVRGFLQILGEMEKYSAEEEHFDLMISELDRANSIITEFLSVANNKNDNFDMCNLNEIIHSIYPLIQSDAFNNNMNVLFEEENIIDIYINSKEIRQLFLNLFRNGLEAMSPGGTLTIKTYTDGGDVVLAIQDEGQGIPPHILDKLGTPFLTTKDTGTGLGLAVCYGIAARHYATINIKTGSQGTTFYVRFKTYEKV